MLFLLVVGAFTLLGLQTDAWLGYSSGGTNALFAAGVWQDADGLMRDMQASGLRNRRPF